ncbi:MAG: dTDP-4-dehydrorhamnose 3,5-epimerase [Chromatiales bacterium]|jgi:dTDP-4-dehydrorhamnose 3,5-epimerase
MNFIKQSISDIVLIEPRVFGDERGFFMETWNQQQFADAGVTAHFVQDNHSMSSHGILRGLHYQIKQPQGKLVRVTAGEVFDVAVDIRRSSPTFGQHVTAHLTAGNKQMLWIPPGFAHGFYAMTDKVEFLYKCTDFYAPEYERTIAWNDAQLGIDWPLDGRSPVLSAKDQAGVAFADAEYFA